MKSRWGLIVAIGILAATGFISAQEKPAAEKSAPGREADEADIRKASQSFAQAFEKGDPKAVADSWTAEGEYVEEGGEKLSGRAAIEMAYSAFFAKRPELKVESKTNSIRFLGEDTAVEEGTFTVHAKDAPTNSSRYSTLYVRQAGRWLIAMLKEWGDEETSRPSLNDLAWLIGTWASEGDEYRALVDYEWSENKAFIRSRFVITPKKGDAKAHPGTQVIGVDPAEGVIRAWTFEPDGGFGGATWTWDGERWAIDSEGTQADGPRTTALNFLTPAGKDAFTWRSVRRTVDGQDLPDIGPIKVNRVHQGK